MLIQNILAGTKCSRQKSLKMNQMDMFFVVTNNSNQMCLLGIRISEEKALNDKESEKGMVVVGYEL